MDLYGLLEATVTGLGYEFVDLEVSKRGKSLRLFVDKQGGISVDDCAFVSNHLTRLLAVELDYDYDRLEVSSPGLDRVLKKEADFVRFNGGRAQIKLRVPVAGRKNYAGILQGVKDGVLQLEVDGALVSLNIADMDKARLMPNI
ncbi:MAG: ribosome maturation factor RimP [Sulfuricella sp.]|nr:ribosome maturation factor RimP [Sulfuricella sp.]